MTLMSLLVLKVWHFTLFFLQDAVTKIFQRALQCNDPKKVHLALLGMYERTEQHKLADELLEKMIKRFKHSCKVLDWFFYHGYLHTVIQRAGLNI